MLAFGAIATAALWVYWYYHSAPFVPLQRAISAEFPRSSPRVDAGQRKIHKGTPAEIWIIMRVEFDLEADDDTPLATADRVKELVNEHLNKGQYDTLHVRLYRGKPEQYIQKRDIDMPLGDAAPTEKEAGIEESSVDLSQPQALSVEPSELRNRLPRPAHSPV